MEEHICTCDHLQQQHEDKGDDPAQGWGLGRCFCGCPNFYCQNEGCKTITVGDLQKASNSVWTNETKPLVLTDKEKAFMMGVEAQKLTKLYEGKLIDFVTFIHEGSKLLAKGGIDKYASKEEAYEDGFEDGQLSIT